MTQEEKNAIYRDLNTEKLILLESLTTISTKLTELDNGLGGPDWSNPDYIFYYCINQNLSTVQYYVQATIDNGTPPEEEPIEE